MQPILRNNYPEPDRMAAQERIAQAIEADPEPFLAAYGKLPESQDGRYICSDLFKETFPEFRESPEARARYNNPLHNSAAVLAAEQLQRKIAEPGHPERDTVIFLTGIPGAGKTSTVLESGKLDDSIRAVFEGQLANPQQAIEKIQSVLDASLKPAILAVHAKAEFALRNTLDRFETEGRGASLHAMATIQSKLPEGLAAIRDTFGDAVRFDVVDRTAGFGQAIQLQGWDKLDLVSQEGSYAAIRERLTGELNRHHDEGTLSQDAYRQALGKLPENWPRSAVRENAERPEPDAQQVTPDFVAHSPQAASSRTQGSAPETFERHATALSQRYGPGLASAKVDILAAQKMAAAGWSEPDIASAVEEHHCNTTNPEPSGLKVYARNLASQASERAERQADASQHIDLDLER